MSASVMLSPTRKPASPRDDRFEIVEDRRELIAKRSLGDRLVAGTIEEARRDDSVEEDLLSAPE